MLLVSGTQSFVQLRRVGCIPLGHPRRATLSNEIDKVKKSWREVSVSLQRSTCSHARTARRPSTHRYSSALFFPHPSTAPLPNNPPPQPARSVRPAATPAT